MDIDHLKSFQRDQIQMDTFMMLPNAEEKLIPDYFSRGADGYYPIHHSSPDYPHQALHSYMILPSSSMKSSNVSFSTSTSTDASDPEPDEFDYDGRGSPRGSNDNMEAMREMIFRIAAMQPINIDPEAVKAPKRRNVRISSDPQSVAARHRRERISERIRILQRLVPGGTKMDTASMLDEAIHYVKFLKRQVQSLEKAGHANNNNGSGGIALGLGIPVAVPDHHRGGRVGHINSSGASFSDQKAMPSYNYYHHQMLAPGGSEQSFSDI